jgi:hypothetical protein
MVAPIAQLDRASDYGSKNALFAIFIIGHQSPASITASMTYKRIVFATIISNLLQKRQTV